MEYLVFGVFLSASIGDLLSKVLEFFADIFKGLIKLLVSFFEVIFDVIRSLLYLVYMIGALAVKLFQVLFELASLLWAFVQGFAKTLASLFFIEQSSSGHGYSEMMGKVASSLDVLQLDVVAYILLFIVWIMTAVGVFKIIGSMKG